MYKTKNGVVYEIFRSLRAGSNSTWTFKKDGNQSRLAFDSKHEVEMYVEEREKDLRLRHFMDTIL